MKKKILIPILSICALGAIVASGSILKYNEVKEPLYVCADAISADVLLADKYVLGDKISLPQNVSLECEGKTYPATVTLRDPAGRGYNTASVVLSVAGQYTIEYKAMMENGQLLKETQTFQCYDSLYSVNGNSSSVFYGAFEEYADTESGLAVDLFAGETLTINKMLNVGELSYNGGVFEEIISLYVAPYTLYSEDVSQLRFTLTDAYNPDNQITIVLKKYTTTVIANEKTYAIHSYVTAGTSEQQIGLERIGSGDFAYGDGILYKVHKNNFYGSAAAFSMTGGFETVGSYVGKDKISFSMNYAEGQIYSQTIRNGATQRNLITDLDDRRLYDELWGGFTTGEAYLSITAMNYKAPSCRFVITDLLGISQDILQSNAFKDEQAPNIQIDYAGNENVPQAIVGMGYPIFNATAQDNYDGDVSVQTVVWANYNKANAFRVSIKDGVFIPDRETEYSIVYTATDKAGNTAKKIVKIHASVDLDRIAIQLGEKAENGVTGAAVQVAPPTLIGGTGNTRLSIYAVSKENPGVRYDIDVETLKFLPLYAGVYEVIYTYGDYIEEKTERYEVVIENSATPYIEDAIQLPKYVIKNGVYTFPAATGYVFGGGTNQKKCAVLVKQDQGPLTALVDNTVKVTAENYLTVIYQLSDGANIFKREYVIPVIDTGFAESDKLDLSKYFYSTTLTGKRENKSVLYTASGANGDTATMEFIKPLLAENFYLDFSTDIAYSQFDGVRVLLTDSENAKLSVGFTIFSKDGKAVLKVNNENIVYDLEESFFKENAPTFSIEYNNKTNSIAVPSGNVKILNAQNGDVFDGFTSNFVYLEIELFGIESSEVDNAGIRISKVNNQSFTGLKNDIIEPEITTRTMRGVMLIGDKADILPLYAADVVDPYVQFTMRVTDPDGQVVTALDGTLLDGCDTSRAYTILLEKYGRYTVYYIATDSAGWSVEYSYVLNVGENVPPTIKISGKVQTGKLGGKIKIAKGVATDNVDETISVSCYLKTPSGVFHNLAWEGIEYNAFTAKETGTYTVYYYAIDSVGNYKIESYDIVVS